MLQQTRPLIIKIC